MPKLDCPCGFVHNLSGDENSFVVVGKKYYPKLLDAEKELGAARPLSPGDGCAQPRALAADRVAQGAPGRVPRAAGARSGSRASSPSPSTTGSTSSSLPLQLRLGRRWFHCLCGLFLKVDVVGSCRRRLRLPALGGASLEGGATWFAVSSEAIFADWLFVSLSFAGAGLPRWTAPFTTICPSRSRGEACLPVPTSFERPGCCAATSPCCTWCAGAFCVSLPIVGESFGAAMILTVCLARSFFTATGALETTAGAGASEATQSPAPMASAAAALAPRAIGHVVLRSSTASAALASSGRFADRSFNRLSINNRNGRGRRRAARPRRDALRQRLVQDDPQRVEIRPGLDPSEPLLRGHVAQRSEHRCRLGQRARAVEARDAEVAQLGPRRREQDVPRLDVAVHEAALVDHGEGCQQRACDGLDLAGLERPARDAIPQVWLDDALHRVPAEAALFAFGMDAHHALMVDCPQRSGLAAEAGAQLGLGGEQRGEHLDRARSRRTFGLVHHAHPSGRQPPRQPVLAQALAGEVEVGPEACRPGRSVEARQVDLDAAAGAGHDAVALELGQRRLAGRTEEVHGLDRGSRVERSGGQEIDLILLDLPSSVGREMPSASAAVDFTPRARLRARAIRSRSSERTSSASVREPSGLTSLPKDLPARRPPRAGPSGRLARAGPSAPARARWRWPAGGRCRATRRR